MFSIRLSSILLAAATMAAGLPSLESRQSSSPICDGMGLRTVPIGSLEVWDYSGSYKYGYISPELSTTLGGGYGVITQSINDALSGAFVCGGPGTRLNSYVMGAANAQTVPGTSINVVGLIAPSGPDHGSPNLHPQNASWVALGPTYVSSDGAKPNSTSVGFGSGGDTWFEGSVWVIANDVDPNGNGHRWFTPTWVDEAFGGARLYLDIAALPERGAIVATGNFAAFAQAYSYVGNWVQVKLACTGNPYAH